MPGRKSEAMYQLASKNRKLGAMTLEEAIYRIFDPMVRADRNLFERVEAYRVSYPTRRMTEGEAKLLVFYEMADDDPELMRKVERLMKISRRAVTHAHMAAKDEAADVGRRMLEEARRQFVVDINKVVIEYVKDHPGATTRELSEYTKRSYNNMLAVLNRIVDAGYLTFNEVKESNGTFKPTKHYYYVGLPE